TPPHARPAANHVGEHILRVVWVIDEAVEFRGEGVGNTEALDHEVGVYPVAEGGLVAGSGGGRVDVLAEAEGEVLCGGVGVGEDGGVPVVNGAVARLLCGEVSRCISLRASGDLRRAVARPPVSWSLVATSMPSVLL